MTVHIKEQAIIAKLAAVFLKQKRMAVTINNKIYLYNCSAKDFLHLETWVCHELMHVQQYQKLGRLKFISFYFLQLIINGYYNNKYEKEARENEHNTSVLSTAKFIL